MENYEINDYLELDFHLAIKYVDPFGKTSDPLD